MKRKWIVMIVAIFAVLSLFASCETKPDESGSGSGSSEYVYEITGVKDVELTVNDTAYDFLQGVTGKKDGKSEAVSVDASDVAFGKAGVYDVTYTCGTENAYAKVYIYTADRKPEIKAEDITLTYAQALVENSIKTGVSATDELGREISFTVSGDYDKNEYGLIKTGEHEITYTAGEGENAKTATRKITVTAGNLPVLAAQTTDLVKPEISFATDGYVFLGLYSAKGEATEDDYILNNNVLTLVGDYIEALGAGKTELCVLFEEGYVTVEITVTDNEKMVYTVENLFDANNYIAGEEVTFARGERGEFSKQNIKFTYKLDGEAITDASKVFAEAGEHTFEVTATRGETSETESFTFSVFTTEDYYKQNFVKQQNVDLWVSNNNEAVTYETSEDGATSYFVLKHTSSKEGNERCFYFKDVMQKAIAAGMNELIVKFASEGEIYLDAYELSSADYYDSPWGKQPWNMVKPMYHGTASDLKLTLDDAYAPASTTGNLMMFAVAKDFALKVTEISFGKEDHAVAYKKDYQDKNVISASVTIAKDVNLENLEFYITDKAASVEGARAGYGLVLYKNAADWNGWVGINTYSSSPVNNFRISRVQNMGPGEDAGVFETDNGKKGCVSPLHANVYNDRAGYYNEDGSKTFTVKFIPDYETNNTSIEFYFGTEKFFTVTPTKAEEMKPIITTGSVVVLVNGKPVASDFVSGFKADAEMQDFYVFEGNEEVILSVEDTEYDFAEGVKIMKNGEEVDFEYNAENVNYGVAGNYKVTYTSGTFKKDINVKINAFTYTNSVTPSILYRETELGIVDKVLVKEETAYTIKYTLNGEEVKLEDLIKKTTDNADKYYKVFDQPGKYVWTIAVTIDGFDEPFTVSQTINVVTSTERLNAKDKVNNLTKITIEFTVNDSTSFDSLEVYVGQKMKTLENARKSSVGLQFYSENSIVMEGYDGNGNQGDLNFKFQKGVDNMGGTTANESSSGQKIWAASLLCHGAYYEYYGGESMTKRNMKFVFTKLDTGYAQIEYYLGNAETGEYTKMFAVWMDETCDGDANARPRFKWPGAKKNVYANIIVNGTMDANEHISNYKVTAE